MLVTSPDWQCDWGISISNNERGGELHEFSKMCSLTACTSEFGSGTSGVSQLLHSFDQIRPVWTVKSYSTRPGKRCLAAELFASLLKYAFKSNLRCTKEIAGHRNVDEMFLVYAAESAGMKYCINSATRPFLTVLGGDCSLWPWHALWGNVSESFAQLGSCYLITKTYLCSVVISISCIM